MLTNGCEQHFLGTIQIIIDYMQRCECENFHIILQGTLNLTSAEKSEIDANIFRMTENFFDVINNIHMSTTYPLDNFYERSLGSL